jgi:hypothetical protein
VNVLVLQVFVSLILVAGALVLFIYTVRQRTLEHADRLVLAPLEDEIVTTATDSPAEEHGCKRNASSTTTR